MKKKRIRKRNSEKKNGKRISRKAKERVIQRGDDPRTSSGCTRHPTPVPLQSLGGFGEDIKRRLDERECSRWERNGWGRRSVRVSPRCRRLLNSGEEVSGGHLRGQRPRVVRIPLLQSHQRRWQGCGRRSFSRAAGRTRGMSAVFKPWGKGQLQA